MVSRRVPAWSIGAEFVAVLLAAAVVGRSLPMAR